MQMDTNGKWQIVCSPQKRWSPLNTGHSQINASAASGTTFHSRTHASINAPHKYVFCGLTPCVVRGSTGRECLRISLRFLLLMPPRGEDSLEVEVRPPSASTTEKSRCKDCGGFDRLAAYLCWSLGLCWAGAPRDQEDGIEGHLSNRRPPLQALGDDRSHEHEMYFPFCCHLTMISRPEYR